MTLICVYNAIKGINIYVYFYFNTLKTYLQVICNVWSLPIHKLNFRNDSCGFMLKPMAMVKKMILLWNNLRKLAFIRVKSKCDNYLYNFYTNYYIGRFTPPYHIMFNIR